MSDERVVIDGSFGEGGGQIIRTALALSAATGISFEAHSIRASREQAGLKTQHLSCIKALKKLCGATAEGDKLGSQELEFSPGEFDSKKLTIDLGTAGALTLLAQSLLLPCLLRLPEIRIRLIGGTDVAWSPSYQYFEKVILPVYFTFGKVQSRLVRRGFYPKGAGEIELKLKSQRCFSPESLVEELRSHYKEFKAERRAKLRDIAGVSFCSMELQGRKVAERQSTGVKHRLAELGVPIKLRKEYCQTSSIGTGVSLWGKFDLEPGEKMLIGADALGEKRISAEEVGKTAAERFITAYKSEGVFDEWVTDSAIPVLGLLGGVIYCSRITEHIRASIEVTEKFLPVQFKCEGNVVTARRL